MVALKLSKKKNGLVSIINREQTLQLGVSTGPRSDEMSIRVLRVTPERRKEFPVTSRDVKCIYQIKCCC